MSLLEIQERVAAAAVNSGRLAVDVSLIAVSKMQPDARVKTVLDQGQRIFGENKVQEASGKWPGFKAQYSGIDLHLIGPLQTNKVKPALALFDAIHTLDRPKLARKLAVEIQALGQAPQLFIQVNTGEEPQKSGILPADLDGFIAQCRTEFDLPIAGLMVIPPIDEEPSLHFALLAKMAKRNGLAGLSMGMSSDFESAIALGATHIRVGSAIFGARG
ncbi:MAG: YggS family pyridoxal phosphate-dependent enzyme [Rhodobacteraceae bacterium]|nr:YggS family pyridoxal phosphate-dependent enzyme [Paracoccaceae bacterium]